MTKLVFDTGPIISLTTNNLLWLLKLLKHSSGCEFLIPPRVYDELVKKPFETNRFKFEALQVQKLVEEEVLQVIRPVGLESDTNSLLEFANSAYVARDQSLRLTQYAEIEALAAAILVSADVIVIDERTTRMMVEHPEKLRSLMQSRLKTKVVVEKASLGEFSKRTAGLKIIRSFEIVAVAFEKGLLDEFVTSLPNAKRELLKSVLWGVKLHGCAVSRIEIDRIAELLGGK